MFDMFAVLVSHDDDTLLYFLGSKPLAFAKARFYGKGAKVVRYTERVEYALKGQLANTDTDPYAHTCTMQETPDGMGCPTCLYC